MLSGMDFSDSITRAAEFCGCEATVLEFVMSMLMFEESQMILRFQLKEVLK